MRLGGWMRLWIVLCAIYGVMVALGESLFLPATAERVTNAEFQRQLSGQQVKLVVTDEALTGMRRKASVANAASQRTSPPLLATGGDWIDALPDVSINGKRETEAPSPNVFDQFDGPIDPKQVVWDEKMPDEFTFGVIGTASDAERERLRQAWNRASDEKLATTRRRSVQTALLIWLIPCLVLLAVGEAIAWVRRGFRQSRSRKV